MDMERVRDRVAAIMERFPADTARITRPRSDAYKQPTNEQVEVGTVRCWRVLPERPESWKAGLAGQTYADNGAFWVCMPWRQDLPEVQHGDVCLLDDGVKRYIRNIQNRGNIRMFWQLSEV